MIEAKNIRNIPDQTAVERLADAICWPCQTSFILLAPGERATARTDAPSNTRTGRSFTPGDLEHVDWRGYAAQRSHDGEAQRREEIMPGWTW